MAVKWTMPAAPREIAWHREVLSLGGLVTNKPLVALSRSTARRVFLDTANYRRHKMLTPNGLGDSGTLVIFRWRSRHG